jgi:capsular exopolysaccharide synthesis family protein
MTKTPRQPFQPASLQSATPLDIALRTVRKSWPLLVTSMIVATGSALFYSKMIAPVYEATALMQFEPNPSRPLAKETDPYRQWSSFLDNHEIFETQFRVISSESVLSAVARDLSLPTDPHFVGPRRGPMAIEDVNAILRGRLKVDAVKNTRLFNITFRDTDPKQARRICEAVARTFMAQNTDKSMAASVDAVSWLSSQAESTKRDLDSSENTLQDFKRVNELPSSSIDEILNMIRIEMQQYDAALTVTRTKKQELIARDTELEKMLENPNSIAASELLSNGFLSGLRNAYQNATKDRDELIATGKGSNHPSVLALDARIENTRHALVSEIENILGAVRHDLAVIQRQEAGEAALYDEARKKAVDLNLKELEYRRLNRARVHSEKLYDALLEQVKSADLARMMSVNTVLMVDPPLEPKGPISPKVPLNVAIGAVAGLVLGLLFAFLREQLDSSLRLPDDVEKQLGLVFLGIMPQLDENENGSYGSYGSYYARRISRRNRATPKSPVELVVHDRPLSGIAEAARTIRTNLMFMNPDRPFRKLLVSSAAPAEGKTTVACSLAIALAQSGQRVCIIDCDLRRPRLHRIFDRVGDAGVTNVLMGDATVEEVAKPTVVENLWSIPTGPLPPNPADILHSERFKRFLDEVGQRFDRVVIDSPPLAAVTDSAILSTLVDGTVFVVRGGKTSKHVSAQGVRALRDVDAPVIGAVLNAVNLRQHEYAYYYRYYYYRSPEAGAEAQGAAAPPN